jgi:hypothetical protein
MSSNEHHPLNPNHELQIPDIRRLSRTYQTLQEVYLAYMEAAVLAFQEPSRIAALRRDKLGELLDACRLDYQKAGGRLIGPATSSSD